MQAVSSRPSLAAPALGAPPRAAPGAAAVAARLSGGRRPRGAPSARRLLLPRALERPPEARDDGRERGSFCPALAAALGVAAVSKIRWAHCVNSRRRLRRALLDERVHMLEVDVSFGELRAPSAAGPACGPAAARGTPAPLGGGSWGPVAAHFPTQRRAATCRSRSSSEPSCSTTPEAAAPRGSSWTSSSSAACGPSWQRCWTCTRSSPPPAAPRPPPSFPRFCPPCSSTRTRGARLVPDPADHGAPAGSAAPRRVRARRRVRPGARAARARPLRAVSGLDAWPAHSGCRLTDAMAEQMLAALPPVQAACDAGLLQHVTFGVSAACARDSAPTLSRIRAAVGDSVDTSVTFFSAARLGGEVGGRPSQKAAGLIRSPLALRGAASVSREGFDLFGVRGPEAFAPSEEARPL
ncbi:unnamed protein product [Prorocentrum cordatum]|uniref:Menorin-like domain-containing protein n=1 Tax=Prorocentrum cordatum TaxID=2364126 RepID=A0ABN9YFD7_9DINO|nr:unnamed protein product [Polarella glacialis]